MATVVRICAYCGKANQKAFKCSRCQSTHYCDQNCQKNDWKKHKRTCIPGTDAKFDEKGAPRDRAAFSDRVKAVGLPKLQQDMMIDRSCEFFAAIDGNFSICDRNGDVVDYTNLLNCSTYTIDWTNSNTCRPNPGTGGSRKCLFLSASSLALELHAMESARVDPHFKYLEGGILYLIGEPHLFWSMLIHWHNNAGVCLPVQNDCGHKWEDTWCRKEFDTLASSVMASGLTPSAGRIKMNSRSQACVDFMMNRDNMLQMFGISLMEENIPPSRALWPDWLEPCCALWSGVLARVAEIDSSRPPCMFYCTPTGCQAGENQCVAAHDREWQRRVEEIKRS
jgi:hypothetical protein